MKILQISHRVPWPLNEGGTIGIYNYTKGYHLAGHEVTLLALDGKKHHTNQAEASSELNKFAKTTLYAIDTDIKPFDALLNLFSNESYNVKRFYHPGFEKLIETTLQIDSFDVIQLEGTFAAPYTDVVLRNKLPNSLVVLRQHNVEFQIWQRLASNCRNPIKKWYLNLLSKRLKAYEAVHLNQYDLVVPVTKEDGELFRSLGCRTEIFSSPAGIDTDKWKPNSKAKITSCYHLGSLEWLPNQEAMSWFIKDIWPVLHSEYPALTFYLAGKNMPEYFRNIQLDGIVVVPDVPDAMEFIDDKAINIVPLLSGSGIRLKILEAMSAGKIILSTTIGAQGIHYTDKMNIFIADNAAQFKNAINMVMHSPELAQSISQNARNLILNEYANHSVIHKLIDKFEEIQRIKSNNL